ncbi:hypothetical protein NIES2104_57690 [Leptolyngbya sp. NIES-2104]|nr:hypothetical protein NIES2104_09550 [Leptolyngbya sp. NIES-2104]GAP99208.1 hypothetical protein NIES2104_57690 [Leptolyngbya sp. NIES-2104]
MRERWRLATDASDCGTRRTMAGAGALFPDEAARMLGLATLAHH